MDKPTSSAPPRHRRYPRAAAAPKPPAGAAPSAEAPAISRRWPRAVPDRRVFPRG